jgi:diadenosine tetraphosphatase ApaH/serine/threonine PP2A family protein phosphatase
MDRTIIVGDVHGCFFELTALLDEIGLRPSDRLIFVGDLIAKGPANREVLDFIRGRRHCASVLGNHEYLLARLFYEREVELERTHLQTIAQLGNEADRYLEWISSLPPYIDLGDFVVVHAGVRPGLSLAKQSVEDLTQLRTLNGAPSGTPWFERYCGKKTVVFGHSVFETPLLKENAIGIDTGCVYGGSLTAVLLPERRLVSIPAVKAYAAKKGESPCQRE